MTAFTPKITDRGIKEAVKARENGLQIAFSKIALGTGKYKPTGLEDFLKNDSLREKIKNDGQKRAEGEHGYLNRMKIILESIE